MSPAHFCHEVSKLTRGVVRLGEPIAKYTSMKVGGPSDCFCVPTTRTEAIDVVRFCREQGRAVTVLGRGTNVLVSDRGIRGAVLRLEEALGAVEISGGRVIAEAGAALSWLIGRTLRAGLVGLEGLAGIPGSVGGAVLMNAGTTETSIGDRVERVTVYDLATDAVRALPRNELEFGYRASLLQRRRMLILAVELALETGDTEVARQAMGALQQRRSSTQPLNYPNAGSVFKNPPGDYAGRLIEQAGLKGLSVGGAQVSQLHANFIVNTGAATATDVFMLMDQMQAWVYEHSGIRLEPELRIVGDWGEELASPYAGALAVPTA